MTTTMEKAISNLLVSSQVLEDAANDPKNYNTQYASYVEQMSWEMYRMANELKEINELTGGF